VKILILFGNYYQSMGRLSTAEAKKSPQSRKLLEEAAGLRRRASYLNRLAHTVRIAKGCAPSERWTEKSGCYDPSMRRLESAEARAGRFIKQAERRRRSNTKMEAAENLRRRTEAYMRIAQENLPNPDDARSLQFDSADLRDAEARLAELRSRSMPSPPPMPPARDQRSPSPPARSASPPAASPPRRRPAGKKVYRGRFDEQMLREAERIAGNVGGKRRRSEKKIYSPTQ
jgi:hypothetical protein